MSTRLLNNTYLYNTTKKKKKVKKRKPSRMERYAKALEKNLPRSEVWFRQQYAKDKHDKFNYPYGKYIPDVINCYYKYIIEVDGSIHDIKEQQFIDAQKDTYYLSRLYKVFRIKAYDMQSFNDAMKAIDTFKASQVSKVIKWDK